ncbi:MAG TPA: DUF6265 family protein [Bacteroidia bacterium]
MKNLLFSIVISFGCLLLFQACNKRPKTDLKKFERLLGAWQYYIDDSTRGFENWYLDTAGQLKGSNSEINNTKIRITEFLSFYVKENKVYYVPQLVKDGKKAPTLFEYIETKDDEFRFTNQQNDFPKFISYKFINNDSMDVSIGDDKNQIHMQYSKRALNIKL